MSTFRTISGDKAGGDSAFGHRSLVQEAYHHIKHMILSNELRSGDKISEKEIAARMNVSRTPIREALKMLEQYGVVEFKPRSYAKVVSITREETIKLAQVRVEIEKLAIRTLMRHPEQFHPDRLLERAERAIAALERGDTAEAYLFDSEFHLELARQSDNSILYDVMERLDSKTHLVRTHSMATREHYLEQLREHVAIVSLLEQGKAEEVMALTTVHITPRFWASHEIEAADA